MTKQTRKRAARALGITPQQAKRIDPELLSLAAGLAVWSGLDALRS